MTVVDDVLRSYTEAESLEAAELALDALKEQADVLPMPIGDLYDELAELAADEEDFALAARVQRKALEHREDHGMPLDADDRLAPAPRPRSAFLERTAWAAAWFPPSQRDLAIGRWPGLADDLSDPGYDRRIEGNLRGMARTLGERPRVAPIDLDEFERFSADNGLDADSGEARSQFAADLARRGATLPWPPGRNDPCWCKSERKYKRCCGAD